MNEREMININANLVKESEFTSFDREGEEIDDVIICDPEGEYGCLVEQFNGEVIKISSNSKDYLNPLDINSNYGDGDAPLKDKANFIMSLLELVVGGSGLTAAEKSVIDRCLPRFNRKRY